MRCIHPSSLPAPPSASQVICTKVRDGDKRIVQLKEGEVQGRHVVIVDDLVQSGSTLVECQVGRRERGGWGEREQLMVRWNQGPRWWTAR